MNPNRITFVILAVFISLLILLSPARMRAQEEEPQVPEAVNAPVGTAFTYQGRLTVTGVPANGSYNFRFYLWDDNVKTTWLGTYPPSGTMAINVVDGYFTAIIDFGDDIFDGGERWLEIEVGGTLLAPLQNITPTPYAIYAQTAPWSGLDGVPAGFSDGVDNDTTTFWSLDGNSGTISSVNYLGTSDNKALVLRVNSAPTLRLEPHSITPNIVVGNFNNIVSVGAYAATISGGGTTGYPNYVTDSCGTVGGGVRNRAGDNAGTTDDKPYATVSGGYYNIASGSYATIGGGNYNTASGSYTTVGGGDDNTASGIGATVSGGSGNTASETASTVGGGADNIASGNSSTISGGHNNTANVTYGTVGGGYDNTASGSTSTIAGGYSNTASGTYAMVIGGYNNTASGSDSFAAGYTANATHNGSFVWSSGSTTTSSWGTNTFTVRAHGGARFYTASGTSTGVQLASGGGSWGSLSDRNLKVNVFPVNALQVLEEVAGLPINTWSYTSQDASIRHMGPMAQDFYSAFGLGEDERYLGTLDVDGVALAAIQGLYQINQELQQENEQLHAELASLSSRLDALEQGDFPRKVSLPVILLAGILAGVIGYVAPYLRRRLS